MAGIEASLAGISHNPIFVGLSGSAISACPVGAVHRTGARGIQRFFQEGQSSHQVVDTDFDRRIPGPLRSFLSQEEMLEEKHEKDPCDQTVCHEYLNRARQGVEQMLWKKSYQGT